MRAIVYSVPGSGTRFVCRFLRDVLGYRQCGARDLMSEAQDAKSYSRYHTNENLTTFDADKRLRELVREQLPVIVPLRSPVATVLSRDGMQTPEEMRALWHSLTFTIDHMNHIVVPVEAPWFDHARLLRLVADWVSACYDEESLLDYAEKWDKVGSAGPRPEREEYDRRGRVSTGTFDSTGFDDETAWYIQRLASFADGAYREGVR